MGIEVVVSSRSRRDEGPPGNSGLRLGVGRSGRDPGGETATVSTVAGLRLEVRRELSSGIVDAIGPVSISREKRPGRLDRSRRTGPASLSSGDLGPDRGPAVARLVPSPPFRGSATILRRRLGRRPSETVGTAERGVRNLRCDSFMDDREFVEPPIDTRTSLVVSSAVFESDQTLLLVVLGLTVVALALSLLLAALYARGPFAFGESEGRVRRDPVPDGRVCVFENPYASRSSGLCP